jgi:two-component system chemotaxis response regulator CheY
MSHYTVSSRCAESSCRIHERLRIESEYRAERTMRILLVDDEADLRSALRDNLRRRFRAEIDEAVNGSHALQRVLIYKYDLVILDLNMPVLNGLDTLRAIRRSPKHGSLPIIMLTGAADEGLVKTAVGLGVFGYLVKPVKTQVLLERVDEVLRRATASDTPPIR